MMHDGWPVLATIHHPITVDRELDLAHADGWQRRLTLRRWYGFVGMQASVARQIPRIVTVSESSRRDIAEQLGVAPERMAVVPVGVDGCRLPAHATGARVRGQDHDHRQLRRADERARPAPGGAREGPHASARTPTSSSSAACARGARSLRLLDRLGLEGVVRFVSGVSDQAIVELYAEAEIAVVPSLYEGFSLPAIEAMACGVPLIATTGGALPEVTGPSGAAALVVAPNDPGSLAQAILTALGDQALRLRLGQPAGSDARERFSWPVTARATAEQYYELLAC